MNIVKISKYSIENMSHHVNYTVYLNRTEYDVLRRLLNEAFVPSMCSRDESVRSAFVNLLRFEGFDASVILDLVDNFNKSV